MSDNASLFSVLAGDAIDCPQGTFHHIFTDEEKAAIRHALTVNLRAEEWKHVTSSTRFTTVPGTGLPDVRDPYVKAYQDRRATIAKLKALQKTIAAKLDVVIYSKPKMLISDEVDEVTEDSCPGFPSEKPRNDLEAADFDTTPSSQVVVPWTPMENGGPERAHVLVGKFSADTVDQLAEGLREFADRVLMGKVTTGVSGGPTLGAIYSYKVRPDQTHDAYFSAVEAWLEERRSAGACAVKEAAASL